jgi:hypothetical protein
VKGRVINHSLKDLWVVETDSGKAVAHKLRPGWVSPRDVDAKGFKAVDATPVDGHMSWIKLINSSTADVRFKHGELTTDCILCWGVDDDEFGPVTYDYAGGWGEPI